MGKAKLTSVELNLLGDLYMNKSPRGLVRLALFIGAISVAVSAQTVVKKGPPPTTSPANGREMYVTYCAACHGVDGKGNGPVASSLKTAPTDLTQLAAMAMHMGGVVSEIYPGSTWIRKFIAAIGALMVSGIVRFAESMVTQAHGI